MKQIKRYIKITYIVGIVAVSHTISAQTQTGPGGVGDTSTLSIWLDASQLNLANGDSITTWNDASGNGNNFTQPTVAARPIFSFSGPINSRPSVNYDGDDFLDSDTITSLSTDVVTWYTVNKSSLILSVGQTRGIIETQTDLFNQTWGTHISYAGRGYHNYNSWGTNSTPNVNIASKITNPLSTVLPHITSSFWSNDDSVFVYLNGVTGTNYPTATVNGTVNNHILTRVGRRISYPSEYFNGAIPEIIAYNAELNQAQNIIVNNYLSTKYAISCGSMDKYAYEGTHDEELIGIGRVDAPNQHLSARGIGIVEIGASSFSNNTFVLIAHTGADLSDTSMNVPSEYLGYTPKGLRLARTWRVAITGGISEITVAFDISGMSMGDPQNYELLVDRYAAGNFATAERHSGILVGDMLTFTLNDDQIKDGDWFTLGNTSRYRKLSEIDTCETCIGSFAPIPGEKYVISAWVKEEGASVIKTSYTYPEIKINFELSVGGPSTTGSFYPTGQIIDGWQKIEAEFDVPSNATNIEIELISGDGDVLFDDIRFFPFDASMKSFVYDPINMRLMAELDERHYATFYEYDEEGKLVRIKKETEKGVMTIQETKSNSTK